MATNLNKQSQQRREDLATFSIYGVLTRKYMNPAKTFSRFKMETTIAGRRTIHDLICFDKETVAYLDAIGVGEHLEVDGELGSEPIKDDKGVDIEIGGYKKWVPMLKVTAVVTKGNARGVALNDQRQPARNDESPIVGDDDIPF